MGFGNAGPLVLFSDLQLVVALVRECLGVISMFARF